MNYYKIKLLLKGKEEEVFIKAETKGEAIQNAEMKHGGVIIKAELSDIPFDEKIKELKNIIEANFSKKKLDYNAFIGASRQLAALTKAQISIKDSLDNISKNTTDPLVKELFEKASEGIDNGKNLSSTFEEYETYIGNLAVAMVKLGEQTGALGEALEALADIYEDIETNRQKFKKAMRYPIITLTAMAGAFTVLIMYVVPKFKEIFEQLHTELPLPTKILLGAEYVLNHYLPLMIAIGIALGVTHKYLYKTSKEYKYKFDAFLLKLKIIGPVIQYSSISRFMLVLTELTKAGIPLIDSLNIANGILENSILKEKIDGIIKEINQGRSLTEGLTQYNLLDNITLQMISAGEDAGNLDEMLSNASAYYKVQFDAIVDGVGDAIEPIMMAVIGGLVLLLALGIFMPMWNMADAAKAG
jgi:general secretion pathway protein F/MSHA biogenesis protein MshG